MVFNPLPGLNLGTVDAGMLIFFPVWGLVPFLAALLLGEVLRGQTYGAAGQEC
jgi:hypothetical protein